MTAITEAVVTAHADATATRTEAEAIGKGWHAYHRVTRAAWFNAENAEVVNEALDGLFLALETYGDLLRDAIHPASAYPELEYEDEAFDKALSMTAQDAADWAGELDRLVPAVNDMAAPAAGGEN